MVINMYRMPYPFQRGKHYDIDGNGCWVWKRNKNKHGYGMVSNKEMGTNYAHRLSYEYHNGLIKDGMYCLHTCDNPACINPEHLFLGTQADNMRDMVVKGRKRGGAAKKFNNTQLMLYGRLNPGWTYKQAGEFFSVSSETIRQRVKRNPQINFGR